MRGSRDGGGPDVVSARPCLATRSAVPAAARPAGRRERSWPCLASRSSSRSSECCCPPPLPGPRSQSTRASRTSRSTSSCRSGPSRSSPRIPRTRARPSQPLSADQVLSIEGLVGTIRAEQEQILIDLIDQDAGLRGRGEVGLLLPARRAVRQAAALLAPRRRAELLIQSDRREEPAAEGASSRPRPSRPRGPGQGVPAQGGEDLQGRSPTTTRSATTRRWTWRCSTTGTRCRAAST